MTHALGPLHPLAAFHQFIVVLLVPLPNGRVDKLPVDYRTGRVTDKGSDGAHNPDVWLSYEAAVLCADGFTASTGQQHRAGFVLTAADQFAVVDIDHCRQSDGSWSPLALDLCAALPGAVVEVSQSGNGMHLWLRSKAMPAHSMKNTALGCECYSSRRFILLGSQATGAMADDCPGIVDVVARYFPPRGTAGEIPDEGPCAEWSGPQDDDALIELAMRSRSAANVFGGGVSFADLWTANADALGHKWPHATNAYDASSADAALMSHLAFYTGKDRARMKRIAWGSALKREKWEREDYMDRTITNACAMQGNVYSNRKREPVAQAVAALGTPTKHRYSIIADDPLNAAKALIERHYTHDDGPRLRCWQESFYRWGGAHWAEMKAPDVRARLYEFLDLEGFSQYRPTKSKVSTLLDALHSAAHLDSSAAPPCWIGEDNTRPPADQIIACANGLLHLPTRTTNPATPAFFSLNALPFNYEPNAPTPTAWLQFLGQVWPDDPEAIAALQEVFGYLLTPDTSQQKIFLLVGPRRSGKGTIGRVLNAVLGVENVASPALGDLVGDFGLQPLVGKLVALISDARMGAGTDQKRVAENLLRISGEDRVLVNRKFLPALSLRLGVRFVLLTNELPKIADASGAMASRFVILSMGQSFLGREDPGLTPRLLRELPGVLAWAVEGWHRLNARGHFVEPRSSAGAAQELADLGSPIGTFVRDECVSTPHAEVEVGALFRAWCTWCAQQGHSHPGTQQTFGRDLRAAVSGLEQMRPRTGGDRIRVYRGLALRGPQWSAVRPTAA